MRQQDETGAPGAGGAGGDEFAEALRSFYRSRHEEVAGRWHRSLPVGELIADRWERARALGFGEGSSIYDSAVVLGDVTVGERTWIGPFTILDGSGGLTIGSTCSISAGVQIYSHDSVRWALSGGQAQYEREPVSIGDHCYIGPLTIVTRGVTIGRHCLVGANSLLNRSLPDYSIAYGTPCRIVGRVVISADGDVRMERHAAPESSR